MICKICGAILSNDDKIHISKKENKKFIFCDNCHKKRQLLAGKIIKYFSVKVPYKINKNYLLEEIKQLWADDTKLAKKLKNKN